MSMRNYLKKLGKRAADSWGRINHPLQMRAASKAIRVRRQSIWDHLSLFLRDTFLPVLSTVQPAKHSLLVP